MIYTYKYLPHRIEGFHANIVYFFEQLFAHDLSVYDEKTLLRSDFIPIVNASTVRLRNNLELITVTYHSLTNVQKHEIELAFNTNTNIDNLCSDTTIIPYKYESFPSSIRKIIKDFLTMLWEEYPQNNALENEYGLVQEHFNLFVDQSFQKALICPFCGLTKLKVSESINRDAYDHYIPKAQYPFTSINFRNLSPLCHECNSDEKKTTDTLFNLDDTRRQVFYPFDTTYNPNHLSIDVVTLEPYNPITLKTLLNDIRWTFSILIYNNEDNRIKSWDDIFHIKRRYKENILRFQIEWYDELIRLYIRSQRKGEAFNDLKSEILEDLDYQKLIAPMGQLKLTYFKFILSMDNIQDKLNATIN